MPIPHHGGEIFCNFVAMLPLSVFQSVEFYVIAVVMAAAIVALSSRRPSMGPVRQVLLPGVITLEEPADTTPSIELLCGDDGTVLLRRHGLVGVNDTGAVSLAIEISGFDVKIKERIVPGRGPGEKVDTAAFILDFMGREHYFISYTAELTESQSNLFGSLTLNNQPGIHASKRLI